MRYKKQNIRIIFDESDTITSNNTFSIQVGATPFTADSLGYRAFFADEIHIASPEALEDSIVCIMKTELIFGIVRSNSDVAMNVIRTREKTSPTCRT